MRAYVAVDDVELAPGGVLLAVRIVEPLAHLPDHVANHRDGGGLVALAAAVEDRAKVLAGDVFHRDEVAVPDFPEIENLRDVGVRELDGDLRLIDEHRDELVVLSDVRKDALDGDNLFEPLLTEGLGAPNLGHSADVDPVEQEVLPKGNRLLLDGHVGARFVRAPPTVRGCRGFGAP